jgi:hypothetical protein
MSTRDLSLLDAEQKTRELAYLEKVEATLGAFSAEEENLPNSPPILRVHVGIAAALRLTRALRLFPLMDPIAFDAVREDELEMPLVNRGESVAVKLFVPKFAGCRLINMGTLLGGDHTQSFRQSPTNIVNPVNGCLLFQHSQENGRRLGVVQHGLASGRTIDVHTNLESTAPRVPMDVSRRVLGKPIMVFDHLKLIWEADWKVAPMRDPLVIGVVGEFYFLVDQWDATKLERYVMAEFVKKPEG